MGSVVLRFGVPRVLKPGDRRISLNVKEPVLGKAGYPVWLNEVVNSKKLLGHRLTLFVQGKTRGKQWFELSGPIRRTSPDGSFILEPKRNEHNQFINDRGDVVDVPEQATLQYSLLKARDGSVVMGKFGKINIQNTRFDGAPSLFTYVTIKLYTDFEALQIARGLYAFSNAPNAADKAIYQESLKEMEKLLGRSQNLFITDGAEYLQTMGLGFDIRVADRSSSPMQRS